MINADQVAHNFEAENGIKDDDEEEAHDDIEGAIDQVVIDDNKLGRSSSDVDSVEVEHV